MQKPESGISGPPTHTSLVQLRRGLPPLNTQNLDAFLILGSQWPLTPFFILYIHKLARARPFISPFFLFPSLSIQPSTFFSSFLLPLYPPLSLTPHYIPPLLSPPSIRHTYTLNLRPLTPCADLSTRPPVHYSDCAKLQSLPLVNLVFGS